MNVLVDTSVWSLALRRKSASDDGSVRKLIECLNQGRVVLIGIILQEILQGISIEERFEEIEALVDAYPLLKLERDDYIEAARVWNLCRANGVQASTADCQIAAACIRYNCVLLTTDQDFRHIAKLYPLELLLE